MSDVPDDIRAAAYAVVERGYNEGLIEAVERALLEERERCAKIAEDFERETGEWDEDINWQDRIAAAIREPDRE